MSPKWYRVLNWDDLLVSLSNSDRLILFLPPKKVLFSRVGPTREQLLLGGQLLYPFCQYFCYIFINPSLSFFFLAKETGIFIIMNLVLTTLPGVHESSLESRRHLPLFAMFSNFIGCGLNFSQVA